MVAVSAVSVAATSPRHAAGHQDATRIPERQVRFQGSTGPIER